MGIGDRRGETERERKCDIGFGDDFLDMTPKEHATEEKVGKLDFMKM